VHNPVNFLYLPQLALQKLHKVFCSSDNRETFLTLKNVALKQNDQIKALGWFFRILIGIFWVGWFYFWIWVSGLLPLKASI
jgi:hypothetical protein